MKFQGQNHPFVVWSSCILWVITIFSIIWSLVLFFCVSNTLFLTGTDLVNAVVLLSGIVMLPTNCYIVYAIANGQRIEHTAKVVCCRLWMCIVWIIIINLIGVMLCLLRIYFCKDITIKYLSTSMTHYRTIPKYKRFIDNLQWYLGCCGIKSYKDWFTLNWHDKIRDYDWSPVSERSAMRSEQVIETDTVPYSCCKSGSCISTFLKELGTYSINTDGCGHVMYRIIMISMYAHLFMFVFVIILEAFLLKNIIVKKKTPLATRLCRKYRLSNIMSVNDNFDISSTSYQLHEEDSEELEASKRYRDFNED